MKLPQNINWLQLVVLLSGLASLFGVNISPSQESDIAQLVGTIAGGVTAAIALITMVVHTFVNHPATLDHVKEKAKEYYERGKAGTPYIAPMLFVLFLVGPLAGGCSALQNWFANGSGQVGDTLTVISSFQSAYTQLCPAGNTQSYCVSSKATAKQMSAAVTLAATQEVSLFETNGDVTQVEAQLLADATQWQNFIQSLNNAGGRQKLALTDVITILDTALTVGIDAYNAIVQASGNYTSAQLNALVTTIQQNNTAIQNS